jgi:hypothetical protein
MGVSWKVELTVECHECGDELSEAWDEDVSYDDALSDCLASEGWVTSSLGEILCSACQVHEEDEEEDGEEDRDDG